MTIEFKDWFKEYTGWTTEEHPSQVFVDDMWQRWDAAHDMGLEDAEFAALERGF